MEVRSPIIVIDFSVIQIDDLRVKLNKLDTRIGKEEEICSRLEKTIAHANETYDKVYDYRILHID